MFASSCLFNHPNIIGYLEVVDLTTTTSAMTQNFPYKTESGTWGCRFGMAMEAPNVPTLQGVTGYAICMNIASNIPSTISNCYGAGGNCTTCADIQAAYQVNNMAFNCLQFKECGCQGANNNQCCTTCSEVEAAYKNRGWAMPSPTTTIPQCNANTYIA